MGSISVRKLDSDTISRLRIKAAGHGVSMEEEARRILTAAVTPSDRIGDLARSIFGSENGISLALPARTTPEPLSFEE